MRELRNPENLPHYLDYYIKRNDIDPEALEVCRHAFTRHATQHDYDIVAENTPGFLRWCSQPDIDSMNKQIREHMIKSMGVKEEPKVQPHFEEDLFNV